MTNSSALIARVGTAAVLIPLLLLAIWFGPTKWVAGLFGMFLIAASVEWAALIGCTLPARVLFAAATVGLAAVIARSFDGATLRLCLLIGACAWWVIGTALVIAAQAGRDALPTQKLTLAGLGWVVLIPSYLALIWLHAIDFVALLFLLALVWTIDSAAYFAGRRWGRRRLAPNVSPGKTWFGALVGVGAAIAVALGAAVVWSDDFARSAPSAVLLAGLTAIAAISGDLFESLMKRRHGLKDSGSLLPGHGGVLDRIDSLLAAAPVFAAFMFVQARIP